MKTSTIVWTLAALIIVLGAGAYYYTATPTTVPANTAAQTEIPNPSGTNLPAGDLAPVPTTPIASSTTTTTSVTASTSLRH